jgi:hypothetical protein
MLIQVQPEKVPYEQPLDQTALSIHLEICKGISQSEMINQVLASTVGKEDGGLPIMPPPLELPQPREYMKPPSAPPPPTPPPPPPSCSYLPPPSSREHPENPPSPRECVVESPPPPLPNRPSHPKKHVTPPTPPSPQEKMKFVASVHFHLLDMLYQHLHHHLYISHVLLNMLHILFLKIQQIQLLVRL